MNASDNPYVAAFQLADKWAKLPPEHLKLALRSADAELARHHELRMAKQQAAAAAERRAHILQISGVAAAFMICIAMLTGSVMTAQQGHFWLSITMCGPSLLALATLFVLRRSSAMALQESARAARLAMNAAQPTAPATTTGTTGAGVV
ncbi:hypothetical protein ACIRG4_09595 [Streptomyces sp. NPDC102395]|uniref:hypothetical protein n=1 Tax=Streptomyces sp. NPDC102395 TaxID=3366168 RepID=UPI0037F89414